MPAFKPGVALEYWNGVPIDRAVQRHSDAGSRWTPGQPARLGGAEPHAAVAAVRPAARRALGHRRLPHRRRPAAAPGRPKEIKICRGRSSTRARSSRRSRAARPAKRARRCGERARSIRPPRPSAAPRCCCSRRKRSPDRQATAPQTRRSARAGKRADSRHHPDRADRDAQGDVDRRAGRAVRLLRIYGFDIAPEPFIAELHPPDPAAARSRPDHRHPRQPGRLHLGRRAGAAAVHAEPHRADALLRAGDAVHAPIGHDRRYSPRTWHRGRRRWTRPSATASCTRRRSRSPIDACNALGQMYGGPVDAGRRLDDVFVGRSVLRRASSTTRSARSSASAPRPAPAVPTCWHYGELRKALAGSPAALPTLPDGIDLSLSFRRATRTGAERRPPDRGCGRLGDADAMTCDDLSNGNRDLIATCIGVLRAQPSSRPRRRSMPYADDPGERDRIAISSERSSTGIRE